MGHGGLANGLQAEQSGCYHRETEAGNSHNNKLQSHPALAKTKNSEFFVRYGEVLKEITYL